MKRTAATLVILAFVLVLVLADPAIGATSAPPISNWGGLEVTANHPAISGALSTWTVPAITCPRSQTSPINTNPTDPSPTELSTWVGIGGQVPYDTLYQVGVDSTCKQGQAHYQGFAETFATGVNNPPLTCLGTRSFLHHFHCNPVQPNDTINARVGNSMSSIPYTIDDVRNGVVEWKATGSWKVSKHLARSAECVGEDPEYGKPIEIRPLAKFNKIRFSSCATVDGHGQHTDLANKKQVNGWQRRVLNIQFDSADPASFGIVPQLATTQVSPLTISWNSSATPTLGHGWVPEQVGFGESLPANITYGGDPTSEVLGITWVSWGGPIAQGFGKSDFAGNSPTVAQGKEETIYVTASDLGLCQGKPAYLAMEWYFPEEGQSYDPTQLQNICTGTNPNGPNSATFAPDVRPTTQPAPTSPPPDGSSAATCDLTVFQNLMAPGVPPDGTFSVKYFACQGGFAIAAGYSSAGASVSLFQANGTSWTELYPPSDGYCMASDSSQCAPSSPLPLSDAAITQLAMAAGLSVDAEGDVVVPAPS